MFKVGTPVRQIVKPIEGRVKRLVVVDEGKELEYLIEFKGADGAVTERHFKEHEIEEMKDPKAKAGAKAAAGTEEGAK